jgi:putative ABC transport system permease protein
VVKLGVLRLAARNLRRRPIRTALTVLGVVVAISFTVGLLSISEGFMISFENSIRRRGVDIYVLPKGVMTVPVPGTAHITFPEEYVDQISTYDNVEVAVPVMEVAIFIGETVPLIVHGIPPLSFEFVEPYAVVEEGRLLKEEDEYAILLGYGLAREKNLGINETINITGRNFTVVGILGRLGGFEDSLARVPLKTLQEVYGREGEVNFALIKVKDIDRVDETTSMIEKTFPELSALTVEELVAQTNELLGIARAIHFSVASVSLLIGILFVFCTMLMAVSERVHEIGTMRAIGASRNYILKLIITESTIMSLIGGVIGCISGYVLSRIINLALVEFVGIAFLETVVNFRLIIAGIVIALGVGGFAGLYPAWKASKQNIVEALRYE